MVPGGARASATGRNGARTRLRRSAASRGSDLRTAEGEPRRENRGRFVAKDALRSVIHRHERPLSHLAPVPREDVRGVRAHEEGHGHPRRSGPRDGGHGPLPRHPPSGRPPQGEGDKRGEHGGALQSKYCVAGRSVWVTVSTS